MTLKAEAVKHPAMKKLRVLFVILLLCINTSSRSQEVKTTYFAIGFFTSAHSQMVTFAYVTYYRGMFMGAEVVRKDRWVYTAMGHWPNPVLNPNRENLFDKYGVDHCFLLKNHVCATADSCWRDSLCHEPIFCSDKNPCKVASYYCPVLDELWKIRFYEHPYDFDRPGWSQGQYVPSVYQKEFLKREYGLENILTDYIYGDSVFKLLKDIQTPGWIGNYKTQSKDTTKTGP